MSFISLLFLFFHLHFFFLLLSLVNWKFSQFHLYKSHLFFAYQQYGNWLFQDVSYDFLYFPFLLTISSWKYKLVAHFEWVGHVIYFSPAVQVSVSMGIPKPHAYLRFAFLACECLSFATWHLSPIISFHVQIKTTMCKQISSGLFTILSYKLFFYKSYRSNTCINKQDLACLEVALYQSGKSRMKKKKWFTEDPMCTSQSSSTYSLTLPFGTFV